MARGWTKEERASMEYTLTVSNKHAWEFFQRNPALSFESCILLTVNIMDSVIQSIHQCTDTSEASLYTKIQTQILDSIQQLRLDLKSPVEYMAQLKLEYMAEMTRLAQSTQLHQTETVRTLLQEAAEKIVDKIHLYIGNAVPHHISDQLVQFRLSLQEESNRMVHGQITAESLALFIDRFESKTTQLLQTAQQPLYACMTATESRLKTELKSIQTIQQTNQSVYENMAEFLNRTKYKNSSAKGRFGETRMEDILNTLYPSAEIINTTSIPNSGDFLIKGRSRVLPDILVETKEYTRNVCKEEVDKFIRDVMCQRKHGVMISHASGIAGKRPFEIEVHQQCIVIYVSMAQYEPERLKIATDMIDVMSQCLSSYLGSAGPEARTILPATLNSIYVEYKKYIDQKLEIMNSVRVMMGETQRMLLDQIQAIQFPELGKFLETTGVSGVRLAKKPIGRSEQYKPPTAAEKMCGEYAFRCFNPNCSFAGKSARSLAGHRKKCDRTQLPTGGV